MSGGLILRPRRESCGGPNTLVVLSYNGFVWTERSFIRHGDFAMSGPDQCGAHSPPHLLPFPIPWDCHGAPPTVARSSLASRVTQAHHSSG